MTRRDPLPLTALILWALPLLACQHHSHDHPMTTHPPHANAPHHGHAGAHHPPMDPAEYVRRMEEPEREAWQQPGRVLDALELRQGQTLCDIGVGPGYFSLRAAPRLGAGGRVYAVDVDADMLRVLQERVRLSPHRNIMPILGLMDDPLLPDGACDLILMVNTYHHFQNGPAYLNRLRRALAPGGRLVNIDFLPGDLPMGPPPEMKVAPEVFLDAARNAGLSLKQRPAFLSLQYFLILAVDDGK